MLTHARHAHVCAACARRVHLVLPQPELQLEAEDLLGRRAEHPLVPVAPRALRIALGLQRRLI